MRPSSKLFIMAGTALVFIALYIVTDLGTAWEYALNRRAVKTFAVILTGSSIAFSTVVFQTMTQNRILTPSIIGMDSLYVFVQTAIVFVFGSTSGFWVNANLHFAFSVAVMMVLAYVLYRALFRRETVNIYFILLIGLILGIFFQSLSSFLQMIIDPNEFLVVQGRMFGSFNNVRNELLVAAAIGTLLVGAYFWPIAKYMDVLGLGKDHAIGLGVNYDAMIRRLWLIVAALISISTALVGPITFLGLLVANLAYVMFQTHRHSILFAGAILLSIVALMAALYLVERVFSFQTTVSVIINFIGSLYFLYIVLKERQA